MQFKKLAILTIVAITFNSCFLLKKSNTDTPIDVVYMDTIEAIADRGQDLKVSEYRGSAARTNDIIHTKLDVSFDWTKQYLLGQATITVKPYFYPTSTLELNARGMEIKEVMLEDHTNTGEGKENILALPKLIPLKFKYENDILTITLNKEYKKEEQYKLFIDYIAKPNELKKGGGSTAITDDKGLYFINADGKEKDKPQQIWTQGETQSSSVWFPTIDSPNERMTQEINITVNKKFTTLSNGELVFSIDNTDSTRTDCWKMELPHAPYLTMMAIGEYAVVKDKWKGKEVNYYVEKEYEQHAKAIFGNTPEMLEFFSNKLGVEYPWNKYAQVVVRDYVSGAMENTTATIHGEFIQKTDRELLDGNNEGVIAHELFHQWFGDLVTCESWSNLPLNESFATYGEYLWDEYKYGKDEADFVSANSRSGYFAEAVSKQKNLIRFTYTDKEDMFDRHSYNKGGQVLHMLRKYVGDDAFFAALKLYLETNKFKSVEIHNLRLAFEEVTGEDLNWFFNQWFLSSGHPELEMICKYDAATKKQKITIKQNQNLEKAPLFKIPMYIDLYMNGQVKREKITITQTEETFELDANVKPDLVNVDAEKMVLGVKNEKKSREEWAFQYKNAPLYLDRIEALSELFKNPSDSISSRIILLALDDKFWAIRKEAIGIVKEIQSGYGIEITNKLITIAKTDPKSEVRAAAINYLANNSQSTELKPLFKNALNDKSYVVVGAALDAIAKINPQEAVELAKQYENEKSLTILYSIISLYSNHGTDVNGDFFKTAANKFTGYNKIGYISQYLSFLKNNKKDETINAGIEVFGNIASDESTSKWVSYYGKMAIKEIATNYNEQASSLQERVKAMKEANPNGGGTEELESEIERTKSQANKITAIYNLLK